MRPLLVAIAVAYAVVAIATGLHRGEDIENHLRLADLLLQGHNFYEPRPPFGTWWPPAAIGLLTPFALVARLSLPLAKATFALVGLSFLYWAVVRTAGQDWRRTVVALAAVLGPIQFDFRYLNVSVILLGVIVAGSLDLERGRELRAGVWFGLATALKLFPALLLVYLAWRRQWRGLAVGVAVVVVLTAVPLAALGPEGAIATARTWIELSATGVPVHRLGNQSLPELLTRLGAPGPLAIVLQLGVIGLAAWALRRGASIRAEVALVTLAAVLLSPIAWWYYFVLAYPAWLVLLERLERTERPMRLRGVAALSGLLMCGVLGPRAWGLPVVSAGVFMWGAMLLFGVLIGTWTSRRPRAAPVPATVSG